ncbi:hypothetical protein Tco_0378952 [Tanacetum coccineum]
MILSLLLYFGKHKYRRNLIDIIYETEKKKSLVSATPLSTAFISTSIVQDFQDSLDDKGSKTQSEYMDDLEKISSKKLLLAKSKRFFKKGFQRFSGAKYKPELRPTRNIEAKYNKVKAKLALLSSSASALKSSMVKNKGLIAEAYDWDEEEVSSDDNEMVEVKVFMALADDNDAVSKEGARNGEWVKISMRKHVNTEILKENQNLKKELKELTTIIETWFNSSNMVNQCISEQIPTQKKRIMGVDQLIEVSSSSGKKDSVFVKSSVDDTKVSILSVERRWLSEAKGFIFPNHDIGIILPAESQRNTIDPLVAVTDSSATDYDSADESSVCSTPIPPLEKLVGAEPIYGPKTIKSILKSNSTFKAEALKGVIVNEPSQAHAKFDEKRGTIFNSNKEVVKIAPRFHRRPYREGFGAFAWQIPILVTISKTVLCHSKLFEGLKVQLGEDPIRARRGGLQARDGEEFNDFLTLYPIPSEYHVILPKSNQTIFDALPGLNPFGYAKLSTFVVMCKAYGCEPYVDLFRWFFNLCRAGKWLTFAKRSEKHVPNLLPKVITRIEENPMFQRLGRYPTSVHVFPDPILFLAGLKPSWEYGQQRPAIMAGDKGSIVLPKEPSPGFGTGSLSVLVNTEPLKADEELMIQPVKVTIDSRESLKPEVFVVHPRSVAARIKDRKCKTRGGLSRPPVMRKFAPRSSTSNATRAKTSSLKDDVPFLIVSDDDEGRLSPDKSTGQPQGLWNLLDSSMTTATQDKLVVDNDVNKRSRELLQVIEKLRGEFDVMKDMEWDREEECEELWVKCEAAMTEFEKNPTVVALQEKISTLFTEVKEHKVSLDRMILESQKWPGYQLSLLTLESKVTSLEAEKARLEAVEVSLRKEVEELKHVRRNVVSKVVPYATMELVYSDHMGSLFGRLVSSVILYGRCRAYEQVADMKEPFDLSKVKDPSALIEALLSKKPPSLQRPAPSRTQVPLPSS